MLFFIAALPSSRDTPSPIDPESIQVPLSYEPDPADLALSSVPGQEMFDPRKRKFSAEELKPQPMIKKARKVFIPEDMKVSRHADLRPDLSGVDVQACCYVGEGSEEEVDPEGRNTANSLSGGLNYSKAKKCVCQLAHIEIRHFNKNWILVSCCHEPT